MAELLTQLQDQLDVLSRRFFECVGVLQRDAPPVAVSDEELVAAPPQVAGAQAVGGATAASGPLDVQATAKRMTQARARVMERAAGARAALRESVLLHIVAHSSRAVRVLQELVAEFEATDKLLQLLPDTPPPAPHGTASGGGGMLLPAGGEAAAAAEAAFEARVRQLQDQDAAVAGELASAVEEVEALLGQLQGLYAALAHATLATRHAAPPLQQQQQQQEGPPV
jgi:hypothetical protein